jgi:uncharacterized protein with HEPN domain
MKKRDDIYLIEIEDRIGKITSYLKKISQEKFLKNDLYRSAIVRELEVIGEAANQISPEIREKFSAVPWAQMIGMRNRLIHAYFQVDYSIVWEVAKKEVPKLSSHVRAAILATAPRGHKWRVCPLGFYDVGNFKRSVKSSAKHPDGLATVREQCRKNPSGKDQLYPKEILAVTEVGARDLSTLGPIGKLKSPPKANNLDTEMLIWTKYWNDVLTPATNLTANCVKALFGSESTFGKNARALRVAKNNFARGPFQVTDQARKALGNENGELKDHFVTATANDIKRPGIAVAAAIRWLFEKQRLASSYLGREASWEEAVADYKGYLRRKKPYRDQTGMRTYLGILAELEGK